MTEKIQKSVFIELTRNYALSYLNDLKGSMIQDITDGHQIKIITTPDDFQIITTIEQVNNLFRTYGD